MRVAFRVDASLDIGTGHVMRCLTLAKALREKGVVCHFICRAHSDHLLEPIFDNDFSVSVLRGFEDQSQYKPKKNTELPSHASWLGCDWVTDALQTSEVLQQHEPHWLVVDHYALDRKWESSMRGLVGKIMVIDDLADRPHDCDLLLDQNLGRVKIDYEELLPSNAHILLGPEFALLRSDFSALREYSLERRKIPKISSILVAMGGVDRQNSTGHILKALGNCGLPVDCTVWVVLGKNAPWLDVVLDLAKQLPWKTEVLIDIEEMAQQLADTDLAIGAAGISSWERCCLGVPSLVAILATNQKPAALHLFKTGIAFSIAIDDSLDESLYSYLNNLQLEPHKLTQMSERAASVTEGKGCQILVDYMCS